MLVRESMTDYYGHCEATECGRGNLKVLTVEIASLLEMTSTTILCDGEAYAVPKESVTPSAVGQTCQCFRMRDGVRAGQ